LGARPTSQDSQDSQDLGGILRGHVQVLGTRPTSQDSQDSQDPGGILRGHVQVLGTRPIPKTPKTPKTPPEVCPGRSWEGVLERRVPKTWPETFPEVLGTLGVLGRGSQLLEVACGHPADLFASNRRRISTRSRRRPRNDGLVDARGARSCCLWELRVARKHARASITPPYREPRGPLRNPSYRISGPSWDSWDSWEPVLQRISGPSWDSWDSWEPVLQNLGALVGLWNPHTGLLEAAHLPLPGERQ
jgi:hypothetical protein